MEDDRSRDEYFYQQGYIEGYIKGQRFATEEVDKFFKNTDKLPNIIIDKIQIKKIYSIADYYGNTAYNFADEKSRDKFFDGLPKNKRGYEKFERELDDYRVDGGV